MIPAQTMLDVSHKPPTARTAVAEGEVLMAAGTLDLLRQNALPKKDPLPTARAAAVLAAKRTADLIPDCHPIRIDQVTVTFELRESPPAVRVRAEVKSNDRTGVEMEALTAAAVACLTVYDIAKGTDPGMILSSIRVLRKTGGKRDYEAAAS